MIALIALAMQAGPPPAVMVTYPEMEGTFRCEVRDRRNRRSTISGEVTEYLRQGESERLIFALAGQGRLDMSGTFYAYKDAALFKMRNWIDFESHLVMDADNRAEIVLIQTADNTANISISYAERGAEQVQQLVGFCDTAFNWTRGNS